MLASATLILKRHLTLLSVQRHREKRLPEETLPRKVNVSLFTSKVQIIDFQEGKTAVYKAKKKWLTVKNPGLIDDWWCRAGNGKFYAIKSR